MAGPRAHHEARARQIPEIPGGRMEMKRPHKPRARETSETVKIYNERAETTQPGSPAAVLANFAVGQNSIGGF